MAHKVQHNAKNMLFFIQMSDKTKAILEYKKLPDNVLEMYHTEVPTNHRGKGLAENLVKNAFKYSIEHNYKIYPTCSYVKKYSRELASEEEKKIVVEQLKQPYINPDAQ